MKLKIFSYNSTLFSVFMSFTWKLDLIAAQAVGHELSV